VYSVGKYLIYGKEKTDQDRIVELENQLKQMNEILKGNETKENKIELENSEKEKDIVEKDIVEKDIVEKEK